jgi:hypothetical protein
VPAPDSVPAMGEDQDRIQKWTMVDWLMYRLQKLLDRLKEHLLGNMSQLHWSVHTGFAIEDQGKKT